MSLDRRTLLAATPALMAWPAFAQAAPAALAAYERMTGGKVGLHAINLATGKTIGWRADERIIMCSTFKLSLAAFALARADRGQERIDGRITFGQKDLQPYAAVAKQALGEDTLGSLPMLEMCRAAVELSDNTCANMLLAHLGGPPALTAFWRKTGDRVSRLDHNEPLLNRSPPGDPRDTTTPAAMAENLRRFLLGDVLSPQSRDRLTGWMVDCKTGANRLRAGLPKSWRIGDKTGNNGKDAFGDVAVAWPKPGAPIPIAAYTQGGTPTEAQVADVFAEIGRMVSEQLA